MVQYSDERKMNRGVKCIFDINVWKKCANLNHFDDYFSIQWKVGNQLFLGSFNKL